jgi:competence protein ComFC
VPMFFLHSLKRGYNQSFLLAKTFAENSQIPYFPLTKKKRWTAHQARLSREERIRNLSGAFVIDLKYSKFLENNTIYIVDDVISTGTTVNEIAGVLKQF